MRCLVGGVLMLACAGLSACAGRTLSDPMRPAPPAPPPPAPIAWTPRTVPTAPVVPRAEIARPARLSATAAPPPAPVFRELSLEPVPDLAAPPSFCSVRAKYEFIDQRQLPAYDAAMRNSVAASAYKADLALMLVNYRDASAGALHTREVAAELGRVGPIADAAYDKAQAMRRLFDTVMAAPVKGRCGA